MVLAELSISSHLELFHCGFQTACVSFLFACVFADVTTLSVPRKDSPQSTSPSTDRRSSNSPLLMGPKPYLSPASSRTESLSTRRASSPLTQTPPAPPEPSDNSGQYVKAITNTQYNSPLGLYAKDTAKETFEDQSKILLQG